MPHVVPAALAALAAFALLSTANDDTAAPAPRLPGLVVTAELRLGLFATTEPVVETVQLRPDGATPPTVLSTSSNIAHRLTVAEVTPCGRARGDDSPNDDGDVEWSSDEGRSWHALTPSPAAIGEVQPAGEHSGVLTMRYRRRAASSTCTLRVIYTAVPAN